MSKISYANLKLKVNTEIAAVQYKDTNIEVLKYLSIEDKISLINIVLQRTLIDNVYSPILMDMYFHLYLIYLYTNISFTDKQKEDEFKLYDTLKSNGLMDMIIAAIPEEEYKMLYEYLIEESNKRMKAIRSAVGLIQSIIHDLPMQAQAAADIVNNFDKEKYQSVIDFAKAANGGRDI